MAEINHNCPTDSTCFKEAVCIDAGRVYDSCCDRDCITDMRCHFCVADRELVNHAVSVKLRKATVVDVNIDVEPVSFNRGYYSCDLTFFFLVEVDVYQEPHSCPTCITGMCFYSKKAILYGSEGSVKTFTNEFSNDCDCNNKTVMGGNNPKCVVSCVEPIALSARLGNTHTCEAPCCVPKCVCNALGGTPDFDNDTSNQKSVFVTLGLFSVIQLIRNVQMLVPVYDFCIPEKQCTDECDSPCDVFKKISFPTDDFFPPRPCDLKTDSGCSCTNDEE